MSSLSNQPPGSPFSEYSELCKVPSMAPATAPQAWDWQHGDMGPPRSLGGAPGLTDEDKLCFFDPSAGVGLDADLKVPGRGGCQGLGSAGESPESQVSSSPSPLSCGNNGVLHPPVPGSPARRMELPLPSSPPIPAPASTGVWNPGFSESSPKTLPPQNIASPNYCVIGVVNDNYLERGDEDSASALGGLQMTEGSSEESEDEEEEEVELEPCFMGRANQQRKALRRAMSECSHLSVPSSLELPDHYPGAGLDELTTPMGGPRRSCHSTMKRSLTVSDDQLPPTLFAAGATRSDLRQDQEPTLHFSPFPPMRDCGGSSPLSPLEGIVEGPGADKNEDVLLPVPGWCKEMEAEAEENDLSEDILGKIRSAVGSAQLLMSQKFQQFYWLCQQNLDPSAMPRPTSQDLAGFWDLLQLSIDDVTAKFDELQQIKNNDWRPVEKSPEKRLPPVAPKKSMIGKRGVTREKSLDLPDRHRLEARRRLMQAKRAASFRQNSVSERADSIEIYIPEAQTRL